MFPQLSGDPFAAAPSASFAPGGVGDLDLDPISRDLLQRASEPASDATPRDAFDPEPQWNFIPMDAEAAQEEEADPELERYLIEEISRASRRRPLMKRLERVEAAYAELPASLTDGAAPQTPPPLPTLSAVPEPPSPTAPINQLMEEFGETMSADQPPSAEWLEKAQRERRRTRRRVLFAWIATLAIGAAIIAATVQGLKP